MPDVIREKVKLMKVAIFTLIMLLFCGQAWSQSANQLSVVCGPQDAMARSLAKYDEVVRWQGVATGATSVIVIAELWHSEDSWSWTLTVSDEMCMVSHGQGLSIFKEQKESESISTRLQGDSQ